MIFDPEPLGKELTVVDEELDEEPGGEGLSKAVAEGAESDAHHEEADLDGDVTEEFAEPAEDEDLADAVDEFDGDGGALEEDEIDQVVELSGKEQSARSLEIRRAIEERMAERQLHEDLDYLDLDMDD